MANQAFNTNDEATRGDNDNSMYAWTDIPIPTSYLNPGITCTLFLKSVYLNDVKCAKNTLIIHPDCPNFPDPMWINVLLNRYLDLDRISTRHYALESDIPQSQATGDIDVTTGQSSNPSKMPKKSVLMATGSLHLKAQRKLSSSVIHSLLPSQAHFCHPARQRHPHPCH